MAKREPKLLRMSAAAHEIGLHPITVRRWMKAGRIQVAPMGREVRVPRAEIERMVGKVDGRLVEQRLRGTRRREQAQETHTLAQVEA